MNTKFVGIIAALIVGAGAVFGVSTLQGCATTPNATQQVAVSLLVQIAVGRVVEKDTKDPAVWAQRATKVAFVADQAAALGEDTFTDVAAVVAALQPIFDRAGLSPSEQLTARTLAATLLALVNQHSDGLEGVKATVHLILADVKQATQIYFTSEAAAAELPAS